MKLEFTADTVDVQLAAADGAPTRTITAVAVPYAPASATAGNNGQRVSFAPGSMPLDGPAPKVFMYHDPSKPVGIVSERVDTPEAMLASMKISKTAMGDEALTLAADGVMAVSVGVNISQSKQLDDGTTLVLAADWVELSLVPVPAFSQSQVLDVAASATVPDEGDENADDPDTTTEPSTEESEEMSEIVEAAEAPEQVKAGVVFAQPKREFRMPSAAEYLAAMHIGGDTFANINKAFHEAARAQRTELEFAAGDELTTDTPGLLPVPVLGPLVQDINFVRPVVNAVGTRAYPDGGAQKTFVRPTITTHTATGTQAAELNAVTAQTMVIAANTVSKTTVAGQVTLSRQDIDFTNPAAMGLILNDLMGEYMLQTDTIASAALLAAASSSGAWDKTAADLPVKIYKAAQDIATNRNWMPTHLLVSVDVFAQLGALTDSTGRPMFPFVGASLTGQNALGSLDAGSWNGNPMGLQLVVDSTFAAKTMIVTRVGTGAGDAFEFYEQIGGVLSLDNPAVLGRNMSFHGYVSTFAAIPGMIRKITQA